MLWPFVNQKENKWIHSHITSTHSERLEKDLLYNWNDTASAWCSYLPNIDFNIKIVWYWATCLESFTKISSNIRSIYNGYHNKYFQYFSQFAEPLPFMVSIFSKSENKSICGGSIIAIKYVLTAYHCVDHDLPDLMVIKKNNF